MFNKTFSIKPTVRFGMRISTREVLPIPISQLVEPISDIPQAQTDIASATVLDPPA